MTHICSKTLDIVAGWEIDPVPQAATAQAVLVADPITRTTPALTVSDHLISEATAVNVGAGGDGGASAADSGSGSAGQSS